MKFGGGLALSSLDDDDEQRDDDEATYLRTPIS